MTEVRQHYINKYRDLLLQTQAHAARLEQAVAKYLRGPPAQQ